MVGGLLLAAALLPGFFVPSIGLLCLLWTLNGAVGTPLTFTLAGVACALLTLLAVLPGGEHRPHPVGPD